MAVQSFACSSSEGKINWNLNIQTSPNVNKGFAFQIKIFSLEKSMQEDLDFILKENFYSQKIY